MQTTRRNGSAQVEAVPHYQSYEYKLHMHTAGYQVLKNPSESYKLLGVRPILLRGKVCIPMSGAGIFKFPVGVTRPFPPFFVGVKHSGSGLLALISPGAC